MALELKILKSEQPATHRKRSPEKLWGRGLTNEKGPPEQTQEARSGGAHVAVAGS